MTDLIRRNDDLTIACGSSEYFRYWIGEQYPMREAAPSDGVDRFCGVTVSATDNLPMNVLVVFRGGIPIKQFTLDRETD